MQTGIAALAALTSIIVLQLLLLHVLSRHLNGALFSRFGTVIYLVISLPGTVIHESSHYVGCLLTRTRVREARLFSPHREGERFVLGYVRHDKPRGPVSSFIIGTAPFWGGAAALWLAAALLIPGTFGAARLSLSYGGLESAFGAFTAFIVEMLRSLISPDWRAWIMLYLLVSVPTHLAPSSADLKNAAWGIVIVSTVLAVLTVLAARFGWALSGPVFSWITALLTVLVGLLTFALFCCIVVSLVVRAISSLIRR